MKFKSLDYLRYLRPRDGPVVTLLLLPPGSYTPSGFYRIEPDGVGGTHIELLERVEVDPRTEKAWYVSCSERIGLLDKALSDPNSVLSRRLRDGDRWVGDIQEEMVKSIMEALDVRSQ